MSLIKKPSELSLSTTLKMLVYGQPGIGKSTLALSAPDPLLLDFDRSVHRVNPKHLKDTVQIDSWQQVMELLEREDLSPYKTLIVDTAGKMIEIMSEFLMQNDPRLRQADGSLTLKGYGARKVMFKSFFARIAQLGKSVIFVAHDVEERDGDTRFVRPEIGGSSGNDLMKELDLVGYMFAQGRKRVISFDATERFYGKNTCNLPQLMEIMDVTQVNNVFMSNIVHEYGRMLEQKTAMIQSYNFLMDLIDENVEGVNSVEKLNEVTEWAKKVEHIWDSKIQAAHKLKDKANAMGAVWNKESGEYQLPQEAKHKKGKAKKVEEVAVPEEATPQAQPEE